MEEGLAGTTKKDATAAPQDSPIENPAILTWVGELAWEGTKVSPQRGVNRRAGVTAAPPSGSMTGVAI